MEEQIEARVSPEQVWAIWERAHALQGQKSIEEGQKGKNRFRYQVLGVIRGRSFSIVWKNLFVKLIFKHEVRPAKAGSLISYQVEIKGLFAWPVRWMLQEKIRKNIRLVLETMVRELETKGVKDSCGW
jgi:hypothetical protein